MTIYEELWDAFGDINFNEPDHRYTDSKGTKYTSATKWIQQFYPEKDWDAIRNKKAAKEGIDPNVLKEQWERNSKYSTTLGTACHSIMELLWAKKNFNIDTKIYNEFPEMKEDYEFRKQRTIELFNKMKKIYVPIANEFIVYDKDHGVCGTIDFLAYNRIKNYYSIIDWKTSKKFETTNHFENYLKAPFEHVKECNTAEYSLQLSLYKAILEKHTSIRIGEMLLFQLPGKDVKIPEVFRCTDFSKEIRKMID